MTTLTVFDTWDDVECRVNGSKEDMSWAVRSVTTQVPHKVFDTIMYWDLWEAKKEMRLILDRWF